jgi:peptidoglycan/xylan/chitin deacetylase (PgdA/CDA1 family)
MSARSGDSTRVPVLVYHSIARHSAEQTGEQRELDVDTGVFRKQMAYLADNNHPVVAFSDLIDELQGRRELPAGAVVITFDDGWQDQYEFAFPILQQRHFTATFFVYTNAIGNGPAFMTWDELRQLQQAGMTIGAHSRTHPILTNPGVSLTNEIDSSRADIARNLGVAPELFAYPYGVWDARIAAAVQAAGFRGARALGGGEWNGASNLFALQSVLATDDMPAFERALADRPPVTVGARLGR